MHKEVEKLHLLILNREEKKAKEYIENNEIDIENKMENGYSYLHCAVQANLLSMIEFLLDKGANINAQDIYGKTPVMLALSTDRSEESKIINYLLNCGADPSIKTYKGIEAKEFAKRIGLNEKIIERL